MRRRRADKSLFGQEDSRQYISIYLAVRLCIRFADIFLFATTQFNLLEPILRLLRIHSQVHCHLEEDNLDEKSRPWSLTDYWVHLKIVVVVVVVVSMMQMILFSNGAHQWCRWLDLVFVVLVVLLPLSSFLPWYIFLNEFAWNEWKVGRFVVVIVVAFESCIAFVHAFEASSPTQLNSILRVLAGPELIREHAVTQLSPSSVLVNV